MDTSSGAKLISFIAKLISYKCSVVSAKKAGGTLSTTNLGPVKVDSMANFPSVVSNQMGALRPGMRKTLLYIQDGPSRIGRVRSLKVSCVSLIYLGLCPFGSAIRGSKIARSSVVSGVSVNNPSVLHSTSGGCTSVPMVYSPGSCSGMLGSVHAGKSASCSAHSQLTTGMFHRATECSTVVTSCLAGGAGSSFPSDLAVAFSGMRSLECNSGPRRGTTFCGKVGPGCSLTGTARLRKGSLSCGGVRSKGTTVSVLGSFSKRCTTIKLGRVGPYKIKVKGAVSST